jgi:hypothetical protein
VIWIRLFDGGDDVLRRLVKGAISIDRERSDDGVTSKAGVVDVSA